MVNVHYIFDPVCGWCFGASSLISQLHEMEGVNLRLHPGGMMKLTPVSSEFRQHILESDKRIEKQTGQAFGERYLEKVANSDETLVLGSYITAQAIIAAEHSGNCGFAMLGKIQQAHYQFALPVSQTETLAELAQQLNIPAGAWHSAMHDAKSDVGEEVQHTRKMMLQFDLGGFPSMVYERNNQWYSVPVSRFYRRSREWQSFWEEVLAPGP